MAELVGVVSSAITFTTLAVQVGKSVKTLKDYWDLMRDAPDDIKWLLREVEMFSSIMADIEADLARKAVPVGVSKYHVSQSLSISKEAVEGLDALCKSLMKDLNTSSRLHRSYHAAKKVLRQKEIEKHISKLNNVVRLLTLSQQCYTRSLMRLQPDLIASSMIHLGVVCSHTAVSSSASAHHEGILVPTEPSVKVRTLGKNRVHRSNNEYLWLLRAPHWMTSRVLEVSGMKLPTGWDWQLRTYQEAPWTSELHDYFCNGKLKELQYLFSSGRLSPFFRSQGYGRTLLHYAICITWNGDGVVEFLLDQGVDPSIEAGYMMETPLCRVLAIGKQAASNRLYPLLPYLRPLLRYSQDLIYGNAQETVEGILSKFHGTPEEFIFLQQHCCPSFYQMPRWTRITIAAQIVLDTPNASYAEEANNAPNLIKTILGQDTLKTKDFQARCFLPLTAKETTLLHCIANRLGASQAFLRMSCRRNLAIGNKYQQFSRPADVHCQKKWQAICKSWSTLFFEFLRVEVNFHQIVDGKTLFIAFLDGYLASQLSLPESKQVPWFDREDFHLGLRAWLRDLKAAGLDLEILGATEWYVWQNERIQREFNGGLHRVIGIAYGPSPEDWCIWLLEPSDSFVGDFWVLIGRPLDIMPGSWPIE